MFAYDSRHFESAQQARGAQLQSMENDIAAMRRRLPKLPERKARNLGRWIVEAEARLASLVEYAKTDGTL